MRCSEKRNHFGKWTEPGEVSYLITFPPGHCVAAFPKRVFQS